MKWALDHSLTFQQNLGGQAVVFREGHDGTHGNFLFDSYQCIKNRPDWAKRLNKVHTSSKRIFLSKENDFKDLDSSTSSDALLMNVFCHPETLARVQVRSLVGVDMDEEITFGFKPRIALCSGRTDTTEVDLKIGDLFIEAKLTEHVFKPHKSGSFSVIATSRKLLQSKNWIQLGPWFSPTSSFEEYSPLLQRSRPAAAGLTPKTNATPC